MRSFIVLIACGLLISANAATPIAWRTTFSDVVFAEASRQQRFVILDLHAVWCHWCHVMDETTYADAKVQGLISRAYLPVSVDADSDPDLTSRYGDWGWPATIVLAPDGTEIVKRRGYIPPAQMASLLQAIIDDPSPGPSVQTATPLNPIDKVALTPKHRAALLKSYDASYDKVHGGWGSVHKLIDADSLELAYVQADAGRGQQRARTTLNQNLLLIDPVWGGVYQYSDSADWRSPHFEKLISYQADDLRLYAEAYVRWHDPRYLSAANAIYGYMKAFLAAPDGGFYVSQDADVSVNLTGHDYYRLSDGARRERGLPKVDAHRYARENGWAIRALAKLYDVTGNDAALADATRAAHWVMANRRLPGGGFRHDSTDRGGPFLDDNLAMAVGLIALYRSTGERAWLAEAASTLDFIGQHLRDSLAGFVSAPAPATARGVFRTAVRSPDQNAALARVASMVNRYTGEARYRDSALYAMKYLTAYAAADDERILPEVLLAERELSQAPIHIVIVGGKQDAAARSLHAAALRYPADYLQVEWLDHAEGNLPNPEIQYPDLGRAAAFACADGACSSPVYDPAALQTAVRMALRR